MLKNEFSLIPYECGVGSSTSGPQLAATYLNTLDVTGLLNRAIGINAQWHSMPRENASQIKIIDKDALSTLSMDIDEKAIAVRRACLKMKASIINTINHGGFPITVGGDHSMGAGSISAVVDAHNAANQTGVLWIDAHPDLNIPEESPSQSLHGMPLRAMLGEGRPNYVSIASHIPALNPKHICVFGARDIDEGEYAIADKLGIRIMTMEDIRANGIQNSFKEAVDIVTTGTKASILSFDIDSMSPDFDLATGTPVDGGFSEAELLPLLKSINLRELFDLFEVTELNPLLPNVKQTADLIQEVMINTLATPEMNVSL